MKLIFLFYKVAEGDFVNINLHVNTFWTDLFANCFLCHEYNQQEGASSITNTLTHDDMLFFVSRIATENVRIMNLNENLT